ncbi:MAG TPA: helix-turn-helix domain-containing protein [Urbifossiella sp.]|jgi:transposase|nr:helix-turn-helix domain-containing protein [Urbifossiella sp.]
MPDHVIKHKVTLSADQRADLDRVTRQSSVGVAKKRWATILLLADDAHPDGGRTDEEIAAEVGLSVRQLERIRKRFVRDGMGTTLVRATRSDAGVPKVLDGKAEAHLVTLCCTAPPDGRDHWTLQLLCDELARLQVVTHVCPETVRTGLKKTGSSPGRRTGSASPRPTGRGSSPPWRASSTPTTPPTTRSTR